MRPSPPSMIPPPNLATFPEKVLPLIAALVQFTPPPLVVAEFRIKLLLVIVPLRQSMAPPLAVPSESAELLLKVLLPTVKVCSASTWKMPPPIDAWLSEKTLLVIEIGPVRTAMAPPLPLAPAELEEKTLLSTVSTLPPLLKMAPPKVPPSSLDELPEKEQFVIVSD